MGKVQAGVVSWMMLAIAGAVLAAPSEEQQRKVWDDVGQAAKKGPVDVPLLDEAVLHVPAGQVFVPQPQADRLLKLFGNPGGHPEMPGLLLPRAPDATWHVPVRFHKSGYIKDDDAKTWGADAMLMRLRDNAEEQNRGRLKSGLRGVESVGWLEPVADLPLAAIEFLPDKRNTDFDAKSDRLAGFGLASLVVANSVVSSQGLVARAAAFLARSRKWFIIGAGLFAAAVAMAIRGLRKTAPAQPAFANTVAEPPRGA